MWGHAACCISWEWTRQSLTKKNNSESMWNPGITIWSHSILLMKCKENVRKCRDGTGIVQSRFQACFQNKTKFSVCAALNEWHAEQGSGAFGESLAREAPDSINHLVRSIWTKSEFSSSIIWILDAMKRCGLETSSLALPAHSFYVAINRMIYYSHLSRQGMPMCWLKCSTLLKYVCESQWWRCNEINFEMQDTKIRRALPKSVAGVWAATRGVTVVRAV